MLDLLKTEKWYYFVKVGAIQPYRVELRTPESMKLADYQKLLREVREWCRFSTGEDFNERGAWSNDKHRFAFASETMAFACRLRWT